ncbi:MAG: hypothetical protein ACLTBV_30720 [Enterocloster bolteae]
MNHRTAGNVDYYLVANSSDERRNLVLSFSHASTPVLLDIEKGDMVQAVYTQAGTAQMCGGHPSGSGVLIYMDLEPGEAVYVLFGLEEDTIRQAKPALTGISGGWKSGLQENGIFFPFPRPARIMEIRHTMKRVRFWKSQSQNSPLM